MRSQCAILVAVSAGLACTGNSVATAISATSTPVDSPDLSLRHVAFARLSEGRLAARGTAAYLDYRRAGGRLIATEGAATIVAEPGTGLASFGNIHVSAPHVDGEVTSRHGHASGGVDLQTARGDHATSEAANFDGTAVRSSTRVDASGPGYTVHGNGLVAQADGSSVQLVQGVKGQLQIEADR